MVFEILTVLTVKILSSGMFFNQHFIILVSRFVRPHRLFLSYFHYLFCPATLPFSASSLFYYISFSLLSSPFLSLLYSRLRCKNTWLTQMSYTYFRSASIFNSILNTVVFVHPHTFWNIMYYRILIAFHLADSH